MSAERDSGFGTLATRAGKDGGEVEGVEGVGSEEMKEASMFQTSQRRKLEVERMSPERARELVEIFLPARLDFYRQPIMEEVETKPPPDEPATSKPQRQQRGVSSAADDLMAARSYTPPPAPSPTKPTGPQAIYGSVSTHDVLVAVRAAMGTNDEAARVVLQEEDIKFVDLPKHEMERDQYEGENDRVKHVGEFVVEVRVKGLAGGEEGQGGLRRVVRVVAQEGA